MAGSSPTFRTAMLHDARDVHALQVAAAEKLTADFGAGYWSNARTLPTIRKHIERGRVSLTEVSDQTCGSFQLSRTKIVFHHKRWFANPRDPALYLTEMAIHPDYQRHGLGRAAMAEIERLAIAADCKAVRFDAYDGAAGAGPFYEKCGYTEVHRGSVNSTKLIYFEKVLG